MPGDTLAVTVREITPTTWGINAHRPGKAAISGLLGGEPDDVAAPWKTEITIRPEQGIAEYAPGIAVPLDPFMGIYATCPDSEERVPTAFPGAFGGNMDCKEMRVGTTIYLPVFVSGALFSTGDGHAAQGDGEVSGTAIEAGMDRLELSFAVQKGITIARPRAESAAHLIFLAFADDLDGACVEALRDVMHYLCDAHGMTWSEAYGLASIAVDFRITQVVDGPRGVHAMLPKCLFATPPTFAVR